jgi:hypothetical protein
MPRKNSRLSQPEPADETKRKPRKESKTETPIEPKPQATTRRKASKVLAETPAEAAGPVPAPVAKPRPTRRPARSLKESESVGDPDAHEPVITFRSRKPPAEKQSPAAVVAISEAAPRGSTRRGKKTPLADDLPVPIWRARQRGATPKPASVEQSDDGRVGARRSRKGRRKDLQDVEITAAAALEPAERPRRGRERQRPETAETVSPPSPETPAKPAPKPIIPIPADAPQIILKDGVPVLVRNKRIYPPISFFGSAPDERRARTVLEEIRLAAESGIHLHVHLVELEVRHSSIANAVAFAGYMLRKTLEADPDAQVLFRVVFLAPAGWSDSFRDAAYNDQSGRQAEPSLCDDAFWGEARDCLRSFIQSLRMLEEKDHIMGLHLERGEWFFSDGSGYDTSKAAVGKFREWARARYINDIVSLRAAWFDGGAEFDTLQVPEFTRPDGGEKFVRSSRKERRWVDFHLFLSDSTVARIADLAYAAKEASEGYFLIGVSYGYTFEWSHPYSGHLSLGKLLRTPEIDFIAGPPSYRSREPGGTAPFPAPIDSYALNGKIYISEEDFKTAIGDWKEPDDFNPVVRTPQALESVHWRGIGAALAHGSGVCWMDLWGNGWLKTSTIWQRGALARSALTSRIGTPLSDPDIAVFIDERSLAYLVDQESFAVLVQNVRESVLRAGVSAGFYLLSDLTHREHFPESKLYIFLNAWDLRPDLRAAIKNRLQRDGKLLFWLYGAGMFDSGRESLERAREVMGVALKPQPFHSRAGTTILNRRHPLCEAFPDKGIIGGTRLGTSYFAIPEEALVLGEYSQTGLPSFVVREFNPNDQELRWTSVFMGEPVVTPALVRALSLQAGAHVWNYQDDVVHVRPPFLTVHCSGTGPRAITLPEKWSAYNLLARDWAMSDSSSLRFNALDGSTHVFIVGRPADIEQILQANPDDLLRLDEIPSRAENTVRFDAFSFDVPIMKLGEWMEGGILDDVSEDWLLHPNVADFEDSEEEPANVEETVGSRRRHRSRKNGDRPKRGGKAAIYEAEEGDLAMNVVFRKRD